MNLLNDDDINIADNQPSSFDNILVELSYFQQHIESLKSHPNGVKQLDHICNIILPTIQRYNEAVKNHYKSKSTQKTWGDRRTLYLP